MARSTAPLFSFQATGNIGQVLQYQRSSHRQIVRHPIKPLDPHVLSQIYHRYDYRRYALSWAGLSAEEKAAWAASAKGQPLTAYNAYLSYALNTLPGLAAWWPLDTYELPFTYDRSPYHSTIELNGALPAEGIFGQALSFDGLDDKAIAWPADQLNYTTQPFTIDCWVYSLPAATYREICQMGQINLQGYGAHIRPDQVLLFHTDQFGARQNTTASALPLSTWTHITITRSGPDVRIYYDGLDATDTPGVHVNPASSGLPFFLGADLSGALNAWNGRIDNVIVLDGALSPADVKLLDSFWRKYL